MIDGRHEMRHAITDRYAVALTTPLIDPAIAMRSRSDVIALCASDQSPWLYVWAASVLHDIVATLPQEDPWRCLAGRTERTTITAPGIGIPDGRSGAWSWNGQFGSVGDALDLVRVSNMDLSRDPGLAPIAYGLQVDSAALLAAAGHSAQAVLDMLTTAHQSLHGHTHAEAIVGVIDPAIRWALHRRSTYTGLDDPYFWVASGAAQRRADLAVGARSEPLDWHTPLAAAAQIEAGAYDAQRAVVVATQ